jgi:hypothetical protein
LERIEENNKSNGGVVGPEEEERRKEKWEKMGKNDKDYDSPGSGESRYDEDKEKGRENGGYRKERPGHDGFGKEDDGGDAWEKPPAELPEESNHARQSQPTINPVTPRGPRGPMMIAPFLPMGGF